MEPKTLRQPSTLHAEDSLITEFAYTLEATDEGIFSCRTQTRYNAAGGLLVSVQKQLISQLSATLAEKNHHHQRTRLDFCGLDGV